MAAQRILAVGRATHVSNEKGKRYQQRVHADYDAFWLERGGVADSEFGFALPMLSLPNVMGGTASERRKAAHLAELISMVRQSCLGNFGDDQQSGSPASAAALAA